MGRVRPAKAISGKRVSDGGEINDTISNFQGESSSVDGLNVRDEAVGYSELNNDTFVRNYSRFSGFQQCIGLSPVSYQPLMFPHWMEDDYYSVGGSSAFESANAGSPHVRAVNDPEKKDVTIVRVSCDIFVRDYGFQTYLRKQYKRHHGHRIRLSLGLNTDINSDSSISGFTELSRTIHHHQLPWSGAKWKQPDRGMGPAATQGEPVTLVGAPLYSSAGNLGRGDFFEFNYGGEKYLQWPYPKSIEAGTSDDTDSAMSFHYVFNYQTTFAWTPEGPGVMPDGSHNGVFALLAKIEGSSGDLGPDWEEDLKVLPTHRDYSWAVTGTTGTTLFADRANGVLGLCRQGCRFPGLFLRNLEMNSITYTKAR
jgi:hypothetical protein